MSAKKLVSNDSQRSVNSDDNGSGRVETSKLKITTPKLLTVISSMAEFLTTHITVNVSNEPPIKKFELRDGKISYIGKKNNYQQRNEASLVRLCSKHPKLTEAVLKSTSHQNVFKYLKIYEAGDKVIETVDDLALKILNCEGIGECQTCALMKRNKISDICSVKDGTREVLFIPEHRAEYSHALKHGYINSSIYHGGVLMKHTPRFDVEHAHFEILRIKRQNFKPLRCGLPEAAVKLINIIVSSFKILAAHHMRGLAYHTKTRVPHVKAVKAVLSAVKAISFRSYKLVTSGILYGLFCMQHALLPKELRILPNHQARATQKIIDFLFNVRHLATVPVATMLLSLEKDHWFDIKLTNLCCPVEGPSYADFVMKGLDTRILAISNLVCRDLLPGKVNLTKEYVDERYKMYWDWLLEVVSKDEPINDFIPKDHLELVVATINNKRSDGLDELEKDLIEEEQEEETQGYGEYERNLDYEMSSTVMRAPRVASATATVETVEPVIVATDFSKLDSTQTTDNFQEGLKVIMKVNKTSKKRPLPKIPEEEIILVEKSDVNDDEDEYFKMMRQLNVTIAELKKKREESKRRKAALRESSVSQTEKLNTKNTTTIIDF